MRFFVHVDYSLLAVRVLLALVPGCARNPELYPMKLRLETLQSIVQVLDVSGPRKQIALSPRYPEPNRGIWVWKSSCS